MAYYVDVRGLLDSLSSSRTVSDSVPMPEVRLGDEVFTFETPASFTVTLTNTGGGIVGSGEVAATYRTTCVRCLCDFTAQVVAPIDGFYIQPGSEEGIPEEQEFEYILDGVRVDVEPAVVQALIVELPYAPVHDEACRGICAVCGADRNVDQCECPAATGPSPFAALAGLLTDEDCPDEG